MRRSNYLPEGTFPLLSQDQPISVMREAMETRQILEGLAVRCDGKRDLYVRCSGYEGVIPRIDAVHPAISGSERDISVLSRVGKPTCFTIKSISFDEKGCPKLVFSRRSAQEQALDWLLAKAVPGTVLPARVTHLARFGAFVDLGCGVISMIPLENLSVSRIAHSNQRLQVGWDVLVLVADVNRDACRFTLSHKELLGTWLENAAQFSPGETVTGIVRSLQGYGAFIELTPNLSGLADLRPNLAEGEAVSVYIKSIRPESRKIKLQIIDQLGCPPSPVFPRYFITDGPVQDWCY